MIKSVENTFEINNTSSTLALKRQMNHISMNKEPINTFFITELRDQLSTIGYENDSKELSLIALGGLPNSWESFIQGINARPKLPKLDQLRFVCLQEEARQMSKGYK